MNKLSTINDHSGHLTHPIPTLSITWLFVKFIYEKEEEKKIDMIKVTQYDGDKKKMQKKSLLIKKGQRTQHSNLFLVIC